MYQCFEVKTKTQYIAAWKGEIYHIYNLFLYTTYLDIYKIKKLFMMYLEKNMLIVFIPIFCQYFAHAFHSSVN